MNTIETRPPQNTMAISTPQELDYADIVRQCAKRKADNGAQFTSTKGKASLLQVVLNQIRSLRNIAKFDENNKEIMLPDSIFNAAKQAIDSFWHTEARSVVEAALHNDARINVRRGVLMSRVDGKGVIQRSKTDKITAVYKPSKEEYRFADTVGLNAAKARLDAMLDNVGKFSREELKLQRDKIATLENALRANQ